jgi:hypothetical protein
VPGWGIRHVWAHAVSAWTCKFPHRPGVAIPLARKAFLSSKRIAPPCMSSTYLVWQYLAELRMAIWHGTARRFGDHSVRKHHSRNVLNDRPGHHAFETCVELVAFDERRSQPNAIAGASTRKTVTLKKTLSSEGGQIGAVCILDAPVPSCSRGTTQGKKARCRSLTGDHRNPTQ